MFIKEGFENQRLIVIPDSIKKVFAKDPLINRLYITDIGYFPVAKKHKMTRDMGAESSICIFCKNGSGWVKTKNNLITIKEGELLIIPPGLPHTYGSYASNPWSIYWMHYSGEDSSKLIGDYSGDLFKIHLDKELTLFFIDNFDHIYLSLQKGYNRENMIILFRLLGYMLTKVIFNNNESKNRIKNSGQIVESCIEYMRRNISNNLTLEDLSSHVNYSVSHLSSIFKHVTGFSPIHYYLQLKVQKACFFLDTSADNISTVSQKVGIHDPLYFSRIFKKIMHQSPREYRNVRKG